MIADLIPKIAQMEGEDSIPYYPRPSLAGPMHREGIDTRCIRSMVYWAGGFVKDALPGRALLIFDDSSWHEELTLDWIRKSIYRVHSEQMKIKVNGRSGKIDALITDPTGRDMLIEHKAINHFSFEKIWNGELPWDYIHQSCDYLYGLQDLNPDISEGLLLLKNKNTAQYIEIWLSYGRIEDKCFIGKMVRSTGEEVKINKVIEWPISAESNLKFKTVADHVAMKTFPKRPYHQDHWRCQYCGWKTTCWESYEQEFAALSDNIALDGEIVDLAKYYLETTLHLSEMEKEKEKLRSGIIKILEEKQIKKGTAGPYNISWSLRSSEKVDKSLIPADILQLATVKSNYFVLSIRKRKEKK